MQGMAYEDIKPHISKSSKRTIAKKSMASDLSRFNTSTMVWFVVRRHKFGLVVTTLVVYVAFNSFGTLIVGLLESFK